MPSGSDVESKFHVSFVLFAALINRSFVVPLNYYPHTRPHRPILSGDLSFFSTIKPSPEEWHQVTSTMTSRPNCNFQPIQCHVSLFQCTTEQSTNLFENYQLFIPSAEIFAITDTIPFHVQLCAPLASLQALADHPRTTSNQQSAKEFSYIRVFLLRQIIVTIHEQRAWRNFPIGEGTLRQLPPICSQSGSFQTLDWDGEVRCNNLAQTGGFNVGSLLIKVGGAHMPEIDF